jgi:hypothetical protein
MTSTGRAARLIVALAIGLAPAACSSTPVPSSTPSPATARPTSPADSGSVVPPPTPTLRPTPPPGSLAELRQLPQQDGLRDARFLSVAFVGDRFLGLGCVTLRNEGCVRPAIWESDDGLEWRTAGPVFLPPGSSSGTVTAAVSTRLGTVAAGDVRKGDQIEASIWLRGADGWAQVTPQSASDSTISRLLATDGRVIAVGSGAFTHFSGFRAWWSADGTTWQAAPSIADDVGGYPTDLLPLEGGLLAWGTACGDVCPVLPSAWWLSGDGTAWQPVEPPRGLDGANVTGIGRTEGGFVAFGSFGPIGEPLNPAAWVADETATDWHPVEPPPQPDATTVRYHLLVGQGSVAAGYAPPGPGREQLRGLVWLRGPGESAWRTPVELPDLEVLALIQHPTQLNRIIVIGRTFEGLQEHLVVWTGLVDWAP